MYMSNYCLARLLSNIILANAPKVSKENLGLQEWHKSTFKLINNAKKITVKLSQVNSRRLIEEWLEDYCVKYAVTSLVITM